MNSYQKPLKSGVLLRGTLPLKEKLLDTSIVAERLSVHPATVRKLINCGALKAIDISSTSKPLWRVKESDFIAFLEQRTV